MAFTFNAINSALDGDQKQNIFDPNAGQQQAPQGAQSDVFQVSGSSASGSSGAPSGGSPTPAAPKPARSPSAYNPGSAQAAYSGIAKVDTTKETGRAASAIAGANDSLQAAANQYTQKANQTAQGYGLDSSVLQKAADGDDASMQAARTRLQKTQADPFEAFGGIEESKLPNAADNFKSRDTFGEIFRPGASANYGSGESRLQGMLTGRDSGFRAQAQGLVNDQKKVIDASDKARVDLTKSTGEMLNKSFMDATGQARAELGSMSDQVMAEAQAKADAENIARAGLDPAKLSQAEFQKLAAELREDFQGQGGDTARSVKYLDDPSGFDLSKYINVDRETNANEFLDQGGVDRFNRINGLLGNGRLATVNPEGTGPQYRFDREGASAAMKAQLAGKRTAEDMNLQTQIDGLIGGATARAGKDQGDALTNAQNYIRERHLNRNEGQSAAEQQAEAETFRQLFNPETNWNPYYTAEGGLSAPGAAKTWQEMLTPAEARQLNEASQGLGSKETYQAGSGYNQPNFNAEYFNNKFDTTFKRIMAEIGGTSPLTTGGGMARDTIVNPLVRPPSSSAGSGMRRNRQN